MVDIKEIEQYCNELLNVTKFKDASYNGLQVLNTTKISKIVTGVSANVDLFTQAAEEGADLVLTHHGLYWKVNDPRLVGILARRVKALDNASLMAYHLPLDAHPQIGNNVLIAEYMGANIEGYFPVKDDEQCISIKASFKEPISYVDSNNPIDKLKAISDYKREVRFINPKPTIQNCVICTGEGGFNMDMDLDGIDALITGEITERYYHLALEKDISIILLGHHYSEVLGIKALGDHLAKKFNLAHSFIDVFSSL